MSNTVSLEKGAKVDITKGTGLTKLAMGLGWDVNEGKKLNNESFDLDAFAAVLKGGKSYNGTESLCFFGKLTTAEGLAHSGDNLTGAGDGDDEVLQIDLSKVPADADEIVFAVNIYKADERKQNFGMVDNAFIRCFDPSTPNDSLAKYDLSEDFSGNTGVIMGKLYKKDGEWKFQALGEAKNGNINQIFQAYL